MLRAATPVRSSAFSDGVFAVLITIGGAQRDATPRIVQT
jgi:hypothetical protein